MAGELLGHAGRWSALLRKLGSDAIGNSFRRFVERITGEVGIARRRLDLDVAEPLGGHQQGLTERECRGGEAVVKAVLDGRVLETIPIMEYVWERTNRVLANEELLRVRE